MMSLPRSSADELAGWMSEIAAGDHTAFAKLFDATSAALYGMALTISGSTWVAEQITRDMYLELWRTAAGYDPETQDAGSWVQVIVLRHAARCARATDLSGASRD
jgi:RNA polymerase sigma-70 factor, ECF subfamily